MIIYKTENKTNGKIYVGQDSHNNLNYFGSGKYIYSAIKKHGKENFTKEIIDSAETKDELNEKEKYWIKFYNCKDPNGYNLTDGGEGFDLGENNIAKRPEIRQKIRNKRALQIITNETKKKISESLKGKSISEETKEKIRNTLIGHDVSEETKEKIRQKTKGKKKKPQTEEHRSKISKSMKRKNPWDNIKDSEGTKKKIGETIKKIWETRRKNKLLKEVITCL
jgi:group I intron endonuclease